MSRVKIIRKVHLPVTQETNDAVDILIETYGYESFSHIVRVAVKMLLEGEEARRSKDVDKGALVIEVDQGEDPEVLGVLALAYPDATIVSVEGCTMAHFENGSGSALDTMVVRNMIEAVKAGGADQQSR